MLDTVTLGVRLLDKANQVRVDDLIGRGWKVRTVKQRDPAHPSDTLVDVAAFAVWEGGVRCAWRPGHGWLSAEVSLPLLVGRKDNSELLTWDECQLGMDKMRAAAADAVKVDLADLDDWRVSRIDPVHAWQNDPAPYIAALRIARLPYLKPRWYEGSLAWQTRGNRTQVRCYDKAAEQGHDVDRPLRLERQARTPNTLIVKDDTGKRLDASLPSWDAQAVAGVLRATMHGLGLDRPVPSPIAARQLLVDAYGRTAGRNLWRALLEAHTCGGWGMLDVSKVTRQRYESRCRKAGVHGVSPVGELPALPGP